VDSITGEGRWVAVGTGNVPLAPAPPPGVRGDLSCSQRSFLGQSLCAASEYRAPQCHYVRSLASRGCSSPWSSASLEDAAVFGGLQCLFVVAQL